MRAGVTRSLQSVLAKHGDRTGKLIFILSSNFIGSITFDHKTMFIYSVTMSLRNVRCYRRGQATKCHDRLATKTRFHNVMSHKTHQIDHSGGKEIWDLEREAQRKSWRSRTITNFLESWAVKSRSICLKSKMTRNQQVQPSCSDTERNQSRAFIESSSTETLLQSAINTATQ